VKSEFCLATLEYLVHIVSQGQIKPVKTKVESVVSFPTTNNRKNLMTLLGMTGYFRNFCPKFSVVAHSMTNLIEEDTNFVWTENCQHAFDKIKVINYHTFQNNLNLDASARCWRAIIIQKGK